MKINGFVDIFKSTFSVFFPNYCLSCNSVLNHFEKYLCVYCSNELSEANFQNATQNVLTQKLSERFSIDGATALLIFRKEGVAQRLIHHLKYHRREQIGKWLGEWLSFKINKISDFQKVDLVIPVPIHPKKRKIRGYNQVTLFGQEIAKGLNADFSEDILMKTFSNSAQAQKHKNEREKATENLFLLQNPAEIKGKHILLVDDVITTGATIEACAKELLKAEIASLQIGCMAYVPNF